MWSFYAIESLNAVVAGFSADEHTHSHMNSLFIEKCVTFRNKYINAFGVTKSDTQKRESERKEKNTNTPTESLKLQFRIKRKIWVSALEGHSNKT